MKVIHIPNSPLGAVVELRELTMDDFMAVQKETAKQEDGVETSMQYLARILHVDGNPVGREALGRYGMSDVLPLIERMNELFGEDDGLGEG